MHQRAQHAAVVELVQVQARLAQPAAAAAQLAERELAARPGRSGRCRARPRCGGGRSGPARRARRPRSASAPSPGGPRRTCRGRPRSGRPRGPGPGWRRPPRPGARAPRRLAPAPGPRPRRSPGSRADGGCQTDTSSAATMKPAEHLVRWCRRGPRSAPEGTPNMTAARGPEPSAAGRRAIHGPAHAKPAGSPIGTRPSPRPASQARSSSSPSGTSAVGTPITVATQAARVERSVWLGTPRG